MTYLVETITSLDQAQALGRTVAQSFNTSLDQAQALGRIVAQSFNVTEPNWLDQFAETSTWPDLRVIHDRGRVMGGLKIYPMGQWFGGQRVTMGGIAGVAIGPEYRGTGAATELMRQVLRQLYDQGVALSTLYPAVQRLYRNVGYEQAGMHCEFCLSPESLQERDRHLPITAIDPTDYALLEQIYRQRAQATNGNLDRHPTLWKRIVTAKTDPLHAYLIGSQTAPEGYLIFHHSTKHSSFDLYLRDVVMLSKQAGQRFWTFLADHRSMVKQVFWLGPSVDPLTCLLAEQPWQMIDSKRWLLRVVNVPKALAARGYPLGLTTELSFAIQDDLLSENNGCFTLQVTDGRGAVLPGGSGELHLHVRGLAPLYSGLLTAHQLQQIGYLTGIPTALATATALFAGPEPWLPDFF